MGRHSQPETGDGVNKGRVKPAKLKCRVLRPDGGTDWGQTTEIFGSGPAKPRLSQPKMKRRARPKNPWE